MYAANWVMIWCWVGHVATEGINRWSLKVNMRYSTMTGMKTAMIAIRRVELNTNMAEQFNVPNDGSALV